MLGKWNYENYTKAIVPLILAVGRFFQGWIESGELNRGELSDVLGLVIVAALVFLAPNVKRGSARREEANHGPNVATKPLPTRGTGTP